MKPVHDSPEIPRELEDTIVAMLSRSPFDFMPSEISYLTDKYDPKELLARAERVEADWIGGRITGSCRAYLEACMERGRRERGPARGKGVGENVVQMADERRWQIILEAAHGDADRARRDWIALQIARRIGAGTATEAQERLWQRWDTVPLAELQAWERAGQGDGKEKA